jgi:hypothetical protein
MSGLILAGIGRGISDAGQTFGNAMMRDYEMTRREALEALREERQGAREEAREVRAVNRVEAAALKDANIYAEAEKSAVGVGDTRRFEKFKKDLGQTDMADEDLRKVFNEQYDQRKVGNFEGADRYVERYSKQKEDVLNEIRRAGGSSGLINQAVAELKGVREAERAADRLTFEQKRADTRDAQVDARNAQNDRRLDLMEERITSQNKTDVIRANKPTGGSGGSSAPKVRSTYTNNQGDKVAVMSDGSEKTLGKAGDFDKSVATLVTNMSKNDYTFSKLPEAEKRQKAIERLTGGTSAPRSGDNAGTRPPLSSFSR